MMQDFFERNHVEKVLDLSMSMELCKKAFELQSRGSVTQSLRDIIKSDDGRILGTMPAYISEGRYKGFGLKSVLVDFNNAKVGKSHEGCILLYDDNGSSAMNIVDAGIITELRTAAASAWATHILASPEANKLAILGSGVQAKRHFQAMLHVRNIESIAVWSRNSENARVFVDWCREQSDIPISIESTPAAAVFEADIICTVTASRDPFLYESDLPAKCHINAVGASAIGFQEIDSEVYGSVDWYVDYREASWSASQCLIKAKETGVISDEDRGKELGEASLNNHLHRRTMYKSVGLAVLDLVFAREVVYQHQELRK
jgi:ornithine cyclodeaminase